MIATSHSVTFKEEAMFLQGPNFFRENEAMMVVVMEFCDLQSLHRAITKKVFKPHGKFSKQATYVSSLTTCFSFISATAKHNTGCLCLHC